MISRAQADSVAPGVARVEAAIALVAVSTAGTAPKDSPTGTAFAVSSAQGSTLFLTAAHVVGCTSVEACSAIALNVYLNGNLRNPRKGRVIAVGSDKRGNDVAAFVVDEGPLPTVDLGKTIGSGHAAAVLGYPRSALAALDNSSLEASASAVFALGTITVDDGAELEGNFRTFPGDSGGPVFDPASGRVSGIVRGQDPASGAYLATGSTVIAAFMQRLPAATFARISTAPPKPSDATAAYAAALRVRTSDPGEYVRDLRIAADAGNGSAADDLALAYWNGIGGPANGQLATVWKTRALQLLKPAAQRGDGAALYRLALIAQRGDILGPNTPDGNAPEYTEKAVLDFTQRAVRAGNTDAMVEFGRDYLAGRLITRDVKLATQWYCTAAVKGNPAGAIELSVMHSNVQSSESDFRDLMDPALFNRWAEIGSELGSPSPAKGVADARALCATSGVKL